ncbi:restriction endonuclease subunit S [Streptococcus suis]|uniref:restriction endonuclease subunit S n=2 Tax=Streptococcus suis TaxID=1307 RepID=UPI000CF60E0F|nr:restriction endonuclease subunit S [Streptococcus suis]
MPNKDKNIPKRRFKTFENDPAWELRKLGEVAISFDYGLNSAATEYDGENKYLRITDIDDDSREFNISDLTSPEINLFGLDEYRLSIGDILFARTGASVGKSYIYRSVDGKVYFAGFLIRVKIKDTFNPDFVFQNTLTSNYERFISITSMRSGQPGVNAQEYSNYEIMFPSLPEQSAIGTFFSTLDRHITLHQRKLDKLKSVKQAYLSEMFPAEGERVPKRRFPGFTDDWELRKLGEVVEVCSGRDYKHLGVGSIPVYGTGGYMLSVSEALSKNNDAIGIGRKGTIDSPYILRAPFWTVDTLFYCIPNDGFTLEFAYSIFQNINWKSMDESTGVPSLSKNGINNVKVLTPKIKEQSAIGTFFSTLDRHITLHQRKLEKLKNLKKALLNELFV